MQSIGLTWLVSATERSERAISKLKEARRDTTSKWCEYLLAEAADELRTALNLCEDSLRALKHSTPSAQPISAQAGAGAGAPEALRSAEHSEGVNRQRQQKATEGSPQG